jgi:ribokinase
MSKSPEIVVVGSHAPGLFLRVRRPPVPGETVLGWDYQEPVDGGKGSNQAIAAARLGGNVAFVGCVGRDRIGDDGQRWMQDAGVNVNFLRRSLTTPSGVGFIMLDEIGVPAMVTSMGANADLSIAEIEDALAQTPSARVLLTQFEMPIEVALHAARIARRQGLTTIVNPAPAPQAEIEGLDAAKILTPNETEARMLLGQGMTGDVDPFEMASQLQARTGAEHVIITLGEKGAVGSNGKETWQVVSRAVDVVDTSGAGDVFCAGLAVGLVEGKDVRDAAEWACAAAALSVTRPGTIPAFPTRDEVDSLVLP